MKPLPARFFNQRFPSKTSAVRICSPAFLPSGRLAYSGNSFERLVLDALLLSKVIEHFINGLHAEKKSPYTILNYEYNLGLFSKHSADRRLQEITPEHIRGFLAFRARDTSPATLHQAFRVLRTFFKWCAREGLLKFYPMENIKAPKLEQKVIATFTSEEIKKLLSSCPQRTFLGERNRSIILCLLDTGMRAFELININLNDVDYRLGIVKVKGKGNKERLMRIGDKTRQVLWKYLLIRDIKAQADQERLFLSEEMRPLTRRGLTTIIYKLGQRAGLKNIRCSPHTFRHTFAVNFLRAGGNIRDLQNLGGWADIQSLVRYTSSLTSEDALRAHKKFSPVDRML
jgi:integrase/recombinase XerC